MATTSLPTFTDAVDQHFLIEPLGGPQPVRTYLDRFPDELYAKTPESHLVRFLQALLGPSGVGQLHADYLRARLIFEDHGIELSNLEALYGSPFRFGRILDEYYTSDPSGTLTQAEWDDIRSKDASYRSRAIDFFNGVRAGNSPEGMRLVARSGLGYDVEIIENYKYLFDTLSDDPIGLTKYGQTDSLNEFIVVPRIESSQSEVQQITLSGIAGGNFQLGFRGKYTGAFSWTNPDVNASAPVVQAALEALPTIGVGNVKVTGGPTLVHSTVVVQPYEVLFTGNLGARDVPNLDIINSLTGTSPSISIDVITTGIDASEETISIQPRDLHALQVALDRIRPVATIPNVYGGAAVRRRQPWASATASSEAVEVLRYVTGQAGVAWPQDQPYQWIEKNVEKQGPRSIDDLDRHYQGFHNVAAVSSSSQHVGPFSAAQTQIFPFLAAEVDDVLVYAADRVLADYPAPLTQTAVLDGGPALIQGIYPTDYLSLAGVPDVRYNDEQFWASTEAPEGAESLILDLGSTEAVNFVAFEVSRVPAAISVDYDVLDNGDGSYGWQPVTPASQEYPDAVGYTADASPWVYTELHFGDAVAHQIFTRYIRVTFDRSPSAITPFLNGAPYSIAVRNLRVGRNLAS